MSKNIRNTMVVAGMVVIALILTACGSRPSQAPSPASASYAATELRVLDTFSLPSTTLSLVALSPDGSRTLLRESVAGEEKWCIYTLDGVTPTQDDELCLQPDEEPGLEAKFVDWDNAVWSPDGGRLAFTELAGRETDLWVLDTSSGQLNNLTDDGISGDVFPLTQDNPAIEFTLDTYPAWAADGKSLFFARSWYRNGNWEGTTIARISVKGGQPETLLTVSDAPGAVRGLIRFGPADRLVYLVSDPDPESPNSGLWMTEGDGKSPQRIVKTGDEKWFQLRQVSAGGEQALILDLQRLNLKVLDLSDGEIRPLKEQSIVYNATFSPDGSKILYSDKTQNGENALLVHDRAGSEENILYTLTGPTSSLVWANNDVLLVGNSLLVQVGGEE
ncbi:MAG: hypothetical protein D6770_06935 [Anaerolineae bacterium]|nr:MAG: hypothetical protein D6770_06935 [Anaerolineae bacterium]